MGDHILNSQHSNLFMVANLYLNTVSQLYYHSGSLLTYMGLKHDGEVTSKIVDGVEVREIDCELTA